MVTGITYLFLILNKQSYDSTHYNVASKYCHRLIGDRNSKGKPESNSTCHCIWTHLSQPAGTCTQQLQQQRNCLLHQKEEAENQMLHFFSSSPITSNQVQMLFPPQESDILSVIYNHVQLSNLDAWLISAVMLLLWNRRVQNLAWKKKARFQILFKWNRNSRSYQSMFTYKTNYELSENYNSYWQ